MLVDNKKGAGRNLSYLYCKDFDIFDASKITLVITDEEKIVTA